MSLASLAINGLLLYLVGRQLKAIQSQIRQADVSVSLDHNRRRSQATIEYWAETLEASSRFQLQVPNDYDLVDDPSLLSAYEEQAVVQYLRLFESLSAGVNMGIFDFETIDRIAGSRIVAIGQGYQAWIDDRRIKRDNVRLYEELEELYKKLERLVRRHSDLTPIDLATSERRLIKVEGGPM